MSGGAISFTFLPIPVFFRAFTMERDTVTDHIHSPKLHSIIEVVVLS